MVVKAGTYLSRIDGPEDLKNLTPQELKILAQEIRDFLIENMARHPGHLGANLGVVELTIALHYIFNSPKDRIIWDVGHQSYIHKILTGRRDVFHTIRQKEGISGFPKPSESEHDIFGTGHSSTSISAALGMAVGEQEKGINDNNYIALIGDGSMTGGEAFEALNNMGAMKNNILVVLNDNGIAIDENTGSFTRYLTRITASHTYNRLKHGIWRVFRGTFIQKIANKTSTALKWTWLKKSNLFEAFNVRYFGPVDGHNIKQLLSVLEDLRDINGPKLLHVITTKGKGYKPAEKDQVTFHAPGRYDAKTGEILETSCDSVPPKYQVIYGKTLTELAEQNDDICAITPAMISGSSLNIFQNRFPERVFDVGIAEQHAVTFAAGLAKSGRIPFCTIYSTFLQRAYDQVIHDVAIQKLPVIFGIDRGGLVGEDGATHHGVFDLAYLSAVPNLIIASPINSIQLRNLMFTAQLKKEAPFAIRYPRGNSEIKDWKQPFAELQIGKAEKLCTGNNVAVLTIGQPGNDVISLYSKLSEAGISVSHYNMIFLKPLDEEALHDACKNHKAIITIEDGTVKGGLGTSVAEFMMEHSYYLPLTKLGVPDRFIEHGTVSELKKECGFDVDGIFSAIKEIFSKTNQTK
ncbi:1-deoxy-D-xylulose-5-phosphate synthase [anaerobic digester metagenome]